MLHENQTPFGETNCLNCETPLTGTYCSSCGQKANLHKDSFWHMAGHFIGDYFHYDNKFWTTIKSLFKRPGEATLEYMDGKRAKYLNPIQLYIFVVTIFVLVTLRADSTENETTDASGKKHEIASSTPLIVLENTDGKLLDTSSGMQQKAVHERDSAKNKKKSTHLGINTNGGKNVIGLGPWTPVENTLNEYDSVQNSLPEAKQDGMLKRALRRKALSYNSYSAEAFEEKYWEAFRHNIPKVLFLLLPFFALLLKLFFWNSKRYYVDHLIFSLHFHSMLFLMIIVDFLAVAIWENELFDEILSYLLLAGSTTYLFLSLIRVYQSSVFMTLLKQFLLFVVYLSTFILSMLFLLFITFLLL